MNNWNYQGKMYHGCYTDADYLTNGVATPWCYVEGYAHCKSAKKSEVTGEDRYYRTCGRDTCAGAKTQYKEAGCCGMPNKVWPLQSDGSHYEPAL